MAKGKDSPSEMARARRSDGISVIFDQNSPASSRSRSRSTSSSGSERSSGSGCRRGRGSYRGRYRSSSSSTSSSSRSRSPSRSRSRSHPRCHRRSSRCGCHNRHRYGRHSSGRRYRSRSRSSSRWSGYSRAGNRLRFRTRRSRSRSRSSGRSVSLGVDDKKELLNAAKANAMKILGTEKLELPESVKPFLSEQSESKPLSSEPETRVRQDPEKTPSQSTEEEPDDMPSPKMSPKRKLISFSINNSVVKPTVAAPSSAKVTPRVDIYESRKPYGHWVPVKSGQTSHARKHTRSTLR